MLIGLHGKKQAGKDTVFERAAHLMRDVLPVERVSFADLLYRSAAASLGATVDQLQRWKTDPRVRVMVGDEHGRFTGGEQSIRQYLQRYGTEAHRDIFGTDFWVDQVSLSDHVGRIVMVTDVRFPNEARAVKAAGGQVVRVLGPEAESDDHASEIPLEAELVDVTVYNRVRDDDFRSLDYRVARLLRGLL